VATNRLQGSPTNAVRIASAVALALLLSACGEVAVAPQQAQSLSAEALALVGAKVYRSPTHAPLADGVVVIRNGRIAEVGARSEVTVPPSARVLDCTGLTLTSGFWNSHVHFVEPKWADATAAPPDRLARQLTEMLTRYGFTTVVDTGSPWAEASALRRRVASGEIDGPRILSAGEILSAAGGLTPPVLQRLGLLPGTAIEITSREQGIEQVRRHVSKGVDAVKIYAATTMQTAVEMPPDILAAIVSEAHQNGKLALAHPHNLRGLQNAIAGGVDVLVHTMPNAGPLTREQIAAMRGKRMSLIPTLKLWTVEAARENLSANIAERFVGVAVGQLRAYAGAGGQILFGTDVGYIDYDPTDEYVLMQRAGMTFSAILDSLTTAPAARFGLSERTGRVLAGMDADLTVLDADPAADIEAFARVRYVLRGGRIIYQSD
jgi:imidazolonepropionase-like amidohydrolase